MARKRASKKSDPFALNGGRYRVLPKNRPLADQITALLDEWGHDATGDMVNLLMHRWVFPERWGHPPNAWLQRQEQARADAQSEVQRPIPTEATA